MKKILLTIGLLLAMAIPQVNADTIKYATVFSPTTGDRKVVVVGDPYAFAGGYMLETSYNYIIQSPDQLGFTVVSNYKTTLSRSITSTASTIYVSSLTTKDSHVLTMADLGTKVFLTIEPGSNKEEIIMATGIGTLSFTNATRGLAFYATSTSAVTANQKSHSAGSAIVMSNVHYVYDQLVDKDTANTIDGVKTYTSSPIVPYSTASSSAASVGYVNATAVAGAPDATASVKGVVELATGAEAAAGASAGSTTGGLVLPASIAKSSSSATNIIPVTGADGKLSANFIATSSDYTWTGTNTFATTTIQSSSGGLSPVGSITAYASTTAPTGWLLANGAAVSRATYWNLFSILGVSYGVGDNSTTFNLPNLLGKNILMASTTANMGQTGGESSHTQTVNELVGHTHTIDYWGSGTTNRYGTDYHTGDANSAASATNSTGGGLPFNVLDPYLVLNYIIKY